MDVSQASDKSSNTFAWIEILLNTPIPDGRHRIISTILAPYLINVKCVEILEAESIIESWVEKCDKYEPVKGNIKAFVGRTCLEAYRLKKKPKDLDYFKTKHGKLYRDLANLASSYGIIIE
jgi:hypothetical protein